MKITKIQNDMQIFCIFITFIQFTPDFQANG